MNLRTRCEDGTDYSSWACFLERWVEKTLNSGGDALMVTTFEVLMLMLTTGLFVIALLTLIIVIIKMNNKK